MTVWQWPHLGETTSTQHLRMGIGSIIGFCAFFVYPCTSYLAMLLDGPFTEKNYVVMVISFFPVILALIFFQKFKSFALSVFMFMIFVISVLGKFLFEPEIRELLVKSTGYYSKNSAIPTFTEEENARLSVTPIGRFAYQISSPEYWSTEVQTDVFNTEITYATPENETAALIISCFNPRKRGTDIPTLISKRTSAILRNTGINKQPECYRSQAGVNACLINHKPLNSSVEWSLYLSDDQAAHGIKISVKSENTTNAFKLALAKSISSVRSIPKDGSISECQNISTLKDFPSG